MQPAYRVARSRSIGDRGEMILAMWVAGAAASSDPGALAHALAERMVEEVGPRPAGSPAADAARAWVAQELRRQGWTPREVRPGRWATVIACRPGASAHTVLFLAHTDSVHARAPGANDNAAAVAVLLQAAEVLAADPAPTPRTVCLGFPDAEEIGLRGSLELARAADTLLGPLDQVMALDLVGRGALTHHGLGPAWGARRLRALLDAAPADVPWVYRGISHAWVEMERSDHLPFTLRGVTASHLMARAESGVDWAYHTPRDTPDRLQPATLDAAVDAVVGVARAPRLPEDPGGPAFVIPGTAVVVGPTATWIGLTLGPALALVGLVEGRPADWRLGTTSALSFVARSVVAAGAAGLALLASTGGRPWELALAGPAMTAAWAAWIAVVAAWPAIHPPVARSLGALSAVVLAATLAWAPLLALPFACAAGAVGLSGAARLGRAVAMLTLVAPVYLLRPDAVRELAFHHLVPAHVGVWVLAFALLTAPVLGTIWDLEARPRRAIGALAVIALLGAVAWGWGNPVEAAPWIRGEVLTPRAALGGAGGDRDQ